MKNNVTHLRETLKRKQSRLVYLEEMLKVDRRAVKAGLIACREISREIKRLQKEILDAKKPRK